MAINHYIATDLFFHFPIIYLKSHPDCSLILQAMIEYLIYYFDYC